MTLPRKIRPFFPRLRAGECLGTGTGMGDPMGDPLEQNKERTKYTRGGNMHYTQENEESVKKTQA